MSEKHLTLADEWKKAAAKNYRRYRRERQWKMGLAITCGVLALSWVIALTAMIAGGKSTPPAEYAKEPVSFTQGEFTPEHILSCVKMENGGTRCSGTVISRGEKYAAILSAAHCVSGNIGGKCTFINPDGSKFEAELLAVDRSLDVCLFRAPLSPQSEPDTWRRRLNHTDKTQASYGPLGHSYVPHRFPDLQSVQKWEACGYTRGQGLKYKEVHPTQTRMVGKDYCYTVDVGPFGGGDSGGSVFADGGLVGVISCCERDSSLTTNKLIIPGSSHAALVQFLKANESKLAQCGPWGCPPQRRDDGYRQRPPGWDPGNNIPIIIPPGSPQQPPQQQPPIQPPAPQCEPYDDSKILSEIKQLKGLIDALQLKTGPAGKDGLPGKDGKDGKDGQSYDPTEMHAIKLRIAELENRPGYDDRKLQLEMDFLKSKITTLENREPEPVTIYLKDETTKEDLARPVTVPAGSSVTYPLKRVLREN